MRTTFMCNVANKERFPIFMSDKCQWWACHICHACLNHCRPVNHAEIFKEGNPEWEEAVKKAGAQFVELEVVG